MAPESRNQSAPSGPAGALGLVNAVMDSAMAGAQTSEVAVLSLKAACAALGSAGGFAAVFLSGRAGPLLAARYPESFVLPDESRIAEALACADAGGIREFGSGESALVVLAMGSKACGMRAVMALSRPPGAPPDEGRTAEARLAASALMLACEKDEAVRKLEERTAFLRAVADLSPSGIAIHRNGGLFYLNSKFRELFGVDSERMQAFRFEEVMAPGEHGRLVAEYGTFPEGAADRPEFNYTARKRGGGLVQVGFRCCRKTLGDSDFIISWHMDVTDRVSIEEDLRTSREMLQSLVDNLPELYYRTDIGGKITYVNKSALDRMQKHGMQNVVGTDITDCYVNPGDRKKFLADLLAMGEVHNYQTALKTPDGTVFHVLATSRLLRDRQGVIIGVEGLARDITEMLDLREELAGKVQEATEACAKLKDAQAHMVQQEKMAALGTLMAGVAHEITNPVNYIAGNLSFVSKSLDGLSAALSSRFSFDEGGMPEWYMDLRDTMADLKESVSDCASGMERIIGVVNNLRSFSRIGGPMKDSIDLDEAVDGTLRFFDYEFRDRIEIGRKYGGAGICTCNPTEINQVLMNILSNAFESIEGRGRVDIETRRSGGQAIIRISDTGCGIPEDKRDFIFEPFFSTKPQGVGLGLSMSYDIMMRHGGRISFESRAGEGTTFTLTIPLGEAE